MRSPLDGNPPITNEHGNAGWGYFGKHAGIDYGVPVGTPVYAPDNGTIRYAINSPDGGNMLEIAIGSYWHRFLHLDSFKRMSGTVKKGELIGYTGKTGNVTGPHLHWDVRKAGTNWNDKYSNYVNPLSLISEEKKEMVTRHGLNVIFRFRRGGEPNDHALKSHLGKRTFDETDKLVRQAAYAEELRKQAKAGKLNAVNFLPKDLREVYVDPSKKTIDNLNKAIKVKDNEIKRLESEVKKLEAIQGNATKWQQITVLLKEILGIR